MVWLEPADVGQPFRARIWRSALAPPLLSKPGEFWRLEADYVYHDIKATLRIPAGFEFDLASVPRVLWALIAPFELSIAAPLLHDFLYRHGGAVQPWTVPAVGYTRAEADRVFAEVMALEGVFAWRRGVAYRAVRMFAGSAWKGG